MSTFWRIPMFVTLFLLVYYTAPITQRALAFQQEPPILISALRIATDGPLQTQTPIPTTATQGAISAPGTIPPAAPDESCGTAATPIHDVQGDGTASPIHGAVITIEGVVVGDFQDTRQQLRGFFVQEEVRDFDNNPATSEGIYVFDNGFGVDVQTGDLVRVRGEVTEFNTLTEIRSIEQVLRCGTATTVAPVTVSLPLE
ncbi:MAG: hypothetical protein R2867_06195 [Caldilineaceae bacterium]